MNINRSDARTKGLGIKKPMMVLLYSLVISLALLTSFCLGWFTNAVVSTGNMQQASVFAATAKVQAAGGDELTVNTAANGELSATLPAGQTYTVNLSCDEKTNGHGRCQIVVGGQTYQTVVFGKCGVDQCEKCNGRETVAFTIEVPEGDPWEIKIESQWGKFALDSNVKEIADQAVIPVA